MQVCGGTSYSSSVGIETDTQLEREDPYNLLVPIFILNSKSRDPR